MSQYIRAGQFGDSGSGKTLTASLLALALSKRLHNGAPICMADAEGAAQFIRPICEIEHVKLLVIPSHSFIDMRDGLRHAESEGCCVYIVDNYTMAHKELTESAKAAWNLAGRSMPYALREELDAYWGEWVRQFRGSSLHVILNGRLGYTWDEVDDEAGDPHLVKLGTKMRGERDMGYEPDLLVELEAIRTKLVRDRRTKTKSGNMRHAAVVLKDRWRELNGKTFLWPDLNEYKKGAYEAVANDFWPHVVKQTDPRGSSLLAGQGVARDSRSLFRAPASESPFLEAQRRRTVAVEESQAILNTIWSGSTNEEKRLKLIVLETVFKSRSWTAIESLAPEVLESAWKVLQYFEADAEGINVKDEAAVIDLITACRALESGRIEAMVT